MNEDAVVWLRICSLFYYRRIVIVIGMNVKT